MMKKIRITKRDVFAFILGIIFMFLIILIYDWKDFKEGVKEGYRQAQIEK